MDRQHIRDRIKELRIQHGMTLKELEVKEFKMTL